MAESKFQFVFLIIAIILISIKITENIMDRFDQPRVLGEVILGILLGPSIIGLIALNDSNKSILKSIFNLHVEEIVLTSEIIEFMTEVAVLFLLFEVGMEIEFDVLKKVGNMAIGAAIGGIITPLLIGIGFVYFVEVLFHPSNFIPEGVLILEVAFYLGAAMTATSVGISIRVFVEMNQLNSRVARTVVGAAVIDDIISIILLTLAITYHEEAGALSLDKTIIIGLQIIGFFLIAIVMYNYLMPIFVKYSKESSDRYLPLISGLVLVFFLAWLASALQLAGIIGAFIAGLIINKDSDFADRAKTHFAPIAHWIIPFFFIGVGLRVDASEALDPTVLLLGVILTILAILSKVIGGIIGTWFTRFDWHESQLVGIAMSARGEVTLIFAATALQLGFFTQTLFSATILMVILNAIIIPPLLKYTYNYWNEENEDKTSENDN